MNNQNIIEMIESNKVIAIARGIEPRDAVALAEALYEGGIRILEFTFNMSDISSTKTDRCIKAVVDEMKDKICVGCGTASYTELVQRAYNMGAKFVISADTNIEVIQKTKQLGLISIPGVLTPTEAMIAKKAGADFIKVFPLGNLGSDYIKAISAPLSHIKFLAVGGVNVGNVREFLDKGCVGVGVGGALVSPELVRLKKFNIITEEARRYTEAIEGSVKNNKLD